MLSTIHKTNTDSADFTVAQYAKLKAKKRNKTQKNLSSFLTISNSKVVWTFKMEFWIDRNFNSLNCAQVQPNEWADPIEPVNEKWNGKTWLSFMLWNRFLFFWLRQIQFAWIRIYFHFCFDFSPSLSICFVSFSIWSSATANFLTATRYRTSVCFEVVKHPKTSTKLQVAWVEIG